MYGPDDITLYVPAYQAAATLDDCLRSLRAQSVHPARLLVIDDGSEPPVDTGLAEVLRQPANRGLGPARNRALDECRTPLIAAVDSDVRAEPDWLATLLDALNGTDVVGVGGRLEEAVLDTLADRWRAVHMAQHWGDETTRDPRFLYGSNTLFRADVLRQVGGYDSALRTNNEDATVCTALYTAGHHLLYTPAARCHHLRRDFNDTILVGYWRWHHAKGQERGDFDHPNGLLMRIEAVNFGIYRYRFDLDRAAGNENLLALDVLLPWVFCAMDLRHFHERTGEPVPAFPDDRLRELAGAAAPWLEDLVPEVLSGHHQAWHDRYLDRCAAALTHCGWQRDTADPAVLAPLARC